MLNTRHRYLYLLAVVLLLSGRRATLFAEPSSQGLDLPRTLQAAPELRAGLHRMLSSSSTFRSQCLRLDEAEKLVVMLRLKPNLPMGIFRARSTVRRYTSGLLIVTVDVAPGANQAEWIAHEFEHVLEQMDGEDLSVQAGRQATGVWHSAQGMIETQRALDAGRAVLMETKTIELPDKFVE